MFDISSFGRFFQEGRTFFEASGFLIWDIYPFSKFGNAVWVLFPGGANFFCSLWLFNMGYLCFFYVEQCPFTRGTVGARGGVRMGSNPE